MCTVCLAENATDVQVAIYELRVAEARLSKPTIERHRNEVIEPIVTETAAALRVAFRAEEKRVLELLYTVKLPAATEQVYVERRTVQDPDTLARLLAAGVSLTAFEAILEQEYLATFSPAMQRVLRDVAWELGHRMPATIGVPLFRDVAMWMRDHAIQFSRKWAPTITETTNRLLRQQLVQGMAAGEGTEQIAERIRSVYKQSARTVKGRVPGLAVQDRASLIARTEAARGYGEARIATGKGLGLRKKAWVLSGTPYSYVDICMTNAEMEEIDVDEPFAHGGQAEPAHPNCLCNTRLVLPEDFELPEGLLAA